MNTEPGSARKTILIVEDDEDIRDYLRLVISSWGYRIELAENGQEAVAVALLTQPDLILMDAMMPLASGIEAANELHKYDKTINIPILFVTAANFEAYGDVFFKFGEVLKKPFDSQELRTHITSMLKATEKGESDGG